MEQTRPKLTDPAALARHRAKVDWESDASFLHRLAFDEMQDRLGMVNRSFTDVVVVSPNPDLWTKIAPGASHITPTDTLDLAENSSDLLIHAMDLHWSNDPVGQIIQSRRSLRADGLFMGCLFGGQTLHELRAVLAAAEAELTGGLSPRILPMAEVRDLGGLLQRGGLGLPVADVSRHHVSYQNLRSLCRDLAAMGESNALAARTRFFTRRELFEKTEEIYQQNYPSDNGGIRATFELIFLAGWSPHPDQPKPLKPGSASHSLAQALDPQYHDTND